MRIYTNYFIKDKYGNESFLKNPSSDSNQNQISIV